MPILSLPMIGGLVPAGFPSPAEDFGATRHDLNELLIVHPLATFLWQVSGRSMEGAGIFDRDILVIDRALRPRHGDIVVAQIDGEATVKHLYQRGGITKLVPANPTFPEIRLRDGQMLESCFVVTACIKRFRCSP